MILSRPQGSLTWTLANRNALFSQGKNMEIISCFQRGPNRRHQCAGDLTSSKRSHGSTRSLLSLSLAKQRRSVIARVAGHLVGLVGRPRNALYNHLLLDRRTKSQTSTASKFSSTSHLKLCIECTNVTVKFSFRELSRSNVGPETFYADWDLSCFFSAPAGKCTSTVAL
jgi:hypothetical protein